MPRVKVYSHLKFDESVMLGYLFDDNMKGEGGMPKLTECELEFNIVLVVWLGIRVIRAQIQNIILCYEVVTKLLISRKVLQSESSENIGI